MAFLIIFSYAKLLRVSTNLVDNQLSKSNPSTDNAASADSFTYILDLVLSNSNV